MNSIVEDILMHYGMPRRSGPLPYGSGEIRISIVVTFLAVFRN